MKEQLEKIFESFTDSGIPGYDCLILENGEEILRITHGVSDGEGTPMRGDERYFLYSSSKPITCTAALILCDAGAIGLDEPLGKYMPEFSEMSVRDGDKIRKVERQIKVRDLFTMTAGFSYDTNSPMIRKYREETGGRCPTREVMRYLAEEPLLFEPGERWEYSLCHDVLAALVETVSGVRFSEFVRENIFLPLGMYDSTFSQTPENVGKVCTQFFMNREGKRSYPGEKKNWFIIGTEYESGGAGCISTVDDYAKFCEALRLGRLLRPETMEMFSTDQLTAAQKRSYWAKSDGYGLGSAIWNLGNGKKLFGWGGVAGFYPLTVLGGEMTFVYAQQVLNTDCDFRNFQMRDFMLENGR